MGEPNRGKHAWVWISKLESWSQGSYSVYFMAPFFSFKVNYCIGLVYINRVNTSILKMNKSKTQILPLKNSYDLNSYIHSHAPTVSPSAFRGTAINHVAQVQQQPEG
jgi:hypothetical protein